MKLTITKAKTNYLEPRADKARETAQRAELLDTKRDYLGVNAYHLRTTKVAPNYQCLDAERRTSGYKALLHQCEPLSPSHGIEMCETFWVLSGEQTRCAKLSGS